MGVLRSIVNGIKYLLKCILNFAIAIIAGVLMFGYFVVQYFKSLCLRQGIHLPFIADAKKMQLTDQVKNAPVKSVGIFQGVYNTQTDQIEHVRYLSADQMDAQTRNVLGNEELVVLS